MMKSFFPTLIIICCSILFSCGNNKLREIERSNIQVEMLNADLEIQFPGVFAVTHKCLVLQDPMRPRENVKLLDTETGDVILGFIDIGQGPEEFATPLLSYSTKGILTIYDPHTLKKVHFNIDSLYEGKVSIKPSPFYRKDIVRLEMLNDNEFIAGVYGKENPFCFIQNDSSMYEFGNYPIVVDIANTHVFHGTVLYNNHRNVMCYATFHTPYLSLYEYKNQTFRMLWETSFKNAQYFISNHQLRWADDHPCGIQEVTFTRDYIACLVKEMYLKDASGRSKETLPRALYLYDYEGTLKKILDLDLASVRISADPETNLVYIIGLDDGWCLARLNL